VLRKRRGWLWENIQGLRDPTDPEGAFIRQMVLRRRAHGLEMFHASSTL
jgi:hypothetical protein